MNKRIIPALTLAAAALVVLWAAGAFRTGVIDPDAAVPRQKGEAPPRATAQARTETVTEFFEAVGTIRPRTETRIEAQITGKVRKVHVRAGDFVRRGDPLIELDDREPASRMAQAGDALASTQAERERARQAVKEAEAALDNAKAQFQRILALAKDRAVTAREEDQARSDFLQAEARVRQAREGLASAQARTARAAEALEETKIALGHAVIRAPEDMEVARRSVEPGDLAVPGKALLVVQTAGAMRLEAHVREGLIGNVRVGGELDVSIPALSRTVAGVVEEVAPSADPATRTFLVKVGLPDMTRTYVGMFGRLLVPSASREAVLVDAAAVRRVGQLETVLVKEGEAWRSVYVKTGQRRGADVEILSGLSGGETVGLWGAAHAG
ncbi:efflux RND transporter periplasmic adaptor subunit [Desulfocurvus sp. DL9XJH121]